MQFPPRLLRPCLQLRLLWKPQVPLYHLTHLWRKELLLWIPRRDPVILSLSLNIGDMMFLKSDKNMKLDKRISCVSNLSLLDLVHMERSAIFDMIQMQGSSVGEVFVLIYWTRENVKGAQTATLSTTCRMEVTVILLGGPDLAGLSSDLLCSIINVRSVS